MASLKDTDLNPDEVGKIKKVLEDAEMYEPNMSEELMLLYYTALKNSENTASEECQTRRLNQSQEELEKLLDEDSENIESSPAQNKEKPFIPKVWTAEKKLVGHALEHNNNENIVEDNILEDIINDSAVDATKTTFGFNEMVKDSEHTLNVITHKLKFIPIQSNNTFLSAGTALKARMLYAYHTKINKMKKELARLSFYPAPLPKITSTTETFPNFPNSDFPETYICRSGRQTKRKIYNYDNDEDSLDGTTSTSTKKVKNSDEQEWFSKPTQNKNSVRSNKKQETNKVGDEKPEYEVDTNKEKRTHPKKEMRLPLSKKISNTEIMKRSSLFSESPKRRCEKIFDKIKEEEEKKEKKEKSMEVFNSTLEDLFEENNEAASQEEIITVDDEEFIRKRVIPPLPLRKGGSRKRNNLEGLTPLDIKVNTPNQQKEPIIDQNGLSKDRDESPSKIYLKKRPAIRKTSNSSDSLPSTSRNSKTITSSNVPCPICNGYFDEDKIEAHAATCGDEPVTRSTTKISRLSCEICDKVLDLNTNYEVHVKECIAKRKDKD